MQKWFGFPAFRQGQDQIVASVLSRRDTLAIMPTGGGKSLCYQLPALMMEGVTLVVSPLIALMKDQLDALEARGIAATLINSSITPAEQAQRINAMKRGAYKLVYVAPERFRDRRFVQSMREARIAFIAIDEAHCVSMWGHDFRPDYLRVGEAVESLGRPPIAAFTATATPEVRADIIASLKFRDAAEFVTGFARPNLEFRITRAGKEDEKYARIEELIETHRTGIVYCATRKRVEEVSATLKSRQCSVIAYHGGMSENERKSVQDEFMQKRADVAVATNAFGMGIDRADIRFVAHFEMPGSLEAYYQEAGRAGRDGQPAVAEFLYGYADKRIQEFFIEGANPSMDLIRRVYTRLRDLADEKHEVVISGDNLADDLKRHGEKVNPMAVSTAVIMLAKANVIERFDIPGDRTRGTRLLQPDLPVSRLPIDARMLAEKFARDTARLEGVVRYGQAIGCRQQWILRYFGEQDPAPCGRCDHCLHSHRSGVRTATAEECVLLQKALSGVARTCTRQSDGAWEPRFGLKRITDMLMGRNTQDIRDAGLDRLTTYGILKPMGEPYVKDLLDECLRAGLLVRTTGEYPLVGLTAEGDKAMRGQADPSIKWPVNPLQARAAARAPLGAAAAPADPAAEALFQELRKLRLRLAKQRSVQTYQIFPDLTLQQLARRQPRTVDEALEISGIGPTKARTVLQPFLDLIAEHAAKSTATSETLFVPEPQPPSTRPAKPRRGMR